MMITKKILAAGALALFLVSCSTEDQFVDIPLDDQSGKIVIEGSVTNEAGPYEIKVSRSIKVTSDHNNYPAVSNAKVTLSDNQGQTELLAFDTVEKVYKTGHFHTSAGMTYTLTVDVDGKIYKATSTMPEFVQLEDLEQDNVTLLGENNIIVVPSFTDPATKGNKYIFKSITGSKRPIEYNFFSDQLDNGEDISFPILSNYKLVKKDTVFVELQAVDAPVYDYFRVLKNAIPGDSGEPIPSNPPSNISNGALGYFSAHSTSVKAIIIQ